MHRSRFKYRRFTLAPAAILALCASPPAQAIDWRCGSDNWSNAACWQGGIRPTAGDTVNISTENGSGTVTIDATMNPFGYAQAKTLGVHSSAVLRLVDGRLEVAENEYIGYTSTATVSHTGGLHKVQRDLYLGFIFTGSGNYGLAGGGSLTAGNEYIGFTGRGIFTHTGGSNQTGTLHLGSMQGGIGNYRLADNGVLKANDEYIGYGSIGDFNQSDGSNEVTNLIVGFNYALPNNGTTPFNPNGNYTFSGGTLRSSFEYIGYYSAGQFVQSGGVNSVDLGKGILSNQVFLGFTGKGEGLYQMSGGSYRNTQIYVGYGGKGTFSQTGGNHSTAGLVLGNNPGSEGSYTLSDNASLQALDEIVGARGVGVFTQTGGNHTIDKWLTLGAELNGKGSYTLSGGTLTTAGIRVGEGEGLFQWTGGTINYTQDDLILAEGASIFGKHLAVGAKQIFNAPNIQVGVNAGVVQSGGSVNAADKLALRGEYALSGGQLSAGSIVGDSGSILIVDGGSLLVGGGNGNLSTGNQYIGYSGFGEFSQSGGEHGVDNALYLGFASGSLGRYTLAGTGRLTTDLEYIGYDGAGNFIQNGGTHTVATSLRLAHGTGSSSSYRLNGGDLRVGSMTDGIGNSAMIIDGGSLSVGNGTGSMVVDTLTLGDDAGKTGSHGINGGSLTSGDEYIGHYGNGRIDQSGGSHKVGKRLMLGYWNGGQGNYGLSGTGELVSGQAFIGVNGNGDFTQSGGIHTVQKGLYLGLNNGGLGRYTLSGGTLATPSEFIGHQGNGSFTQSGGNHTVTGVLTLGKYAGSRGSYELNGGTLTTAGIVAGAGHAIFNWNGGKLHYTSDFSVADGASVFGNRLAVANNSHFIAPTMQVATNGVVTQGNGSSVVIAGQLSQRGNYTLAGGASLQTAGLDNWGNLAFGAGVSDIYGDVTNNAGGNISNRFSSFIQLARFNGALLNNGEVHTGKNALSLFYGAVSGSGSFTGDGTSIFFGGLRPGNSPARVNASGDVFLADGNQTRMELGGLVRGSEYDAFDVLPGSLTLGGSLNVDWHNGFSARAGDSFDLFMADSISGVFASTLFPTLNGVNWQIALIHDAYGSIDVYRLTAAPVPIPAAAWLMGAGLMGLVIGARRKG